MIAANQPSFPLRYPADHSITVELDLVLPLVSSRSLFCEGRQLHLDTRGKSLGLCSAIGDFRCARLFRGRDGSRFSYAPRFGTPHRIRSRRNLVEVSSGA